MTKQELIRAWRDYEAQANAAFTSEPFNVVTAFDTMMRAEIEATPASTAGRLLVQHGDDAARVRFEDRIANGLAIADDEVYRLLVEAS
jgi:hypothetical protein